MHTHTHTPHMNIFDATPFVTHFLPNYLSLNWRNRGGSSEEVTSSQALTGFLFAKWYWFIYSLRTHKHVNYLFYPR